MPMTAPSRKYGVIGIAATIAIMLAFLLAANATVNRRTNFKETIATQEHVDRVICARVNKIYVQITKQVQISIAQTPKLAYYKTHPADLRKVQDIQRDELVAFRPQPCPKP